MSKKKTTALYKNLSPRKKDTIKEKTIRPEDIVTPPTDIIAFGHISHNRIKFEECNFTERVDIIKSSNLTFKDSEIYLKSIRKSDNILFKNCTIKTPKSDSKWIEESESITFKNCTIKGKCIGIDSSSISLKNCNIINLDEAINSSESNITIKHSIIENCNKFLELEKSNLYARLLEIDKTKECINRDNKTSTKIISTPKLTLALI